MNKPNLYQASCAVGIEKVLSEELSRLGIKETERSAGRIGFEADDDTLAKALVNIRTSERIFAEAGSFYADDFDMLFEGIKNIEWEKWIGKDDKLTIDKVKSIRSTLSSQNAVQSMSHKAAYDRLCKKYGLNRMPETGNQVTARIRIDENNVRVEIDMCGLALSKRGYRKHPTEAPLKESVAASLLYLSGWRSNFPLYDPFCGSGTIAIEAALIAYNIAPGMNRNFSWERMPLSGKKFLDIAKQNAHDSVKLEQDAMIGASDLDGSTVEAAISNASLAGVSKKIKIFHANALEAEPFANKGFLITDPPYGKRLGTPEEAAKLYSSLGDVAKRFNKWNLCFVVDREDFPTFIKGRKSWKKTKITEGAEIRFFHRSAN